MRVPKTVGEKAIVLVRQLHLFNKGLKIQGIGNSLCIPLARKPRQEELETLRESLSTFEISSRKLPNRTKQQPTLADLLEDMLPPHLLASLPRAADFVGSIAVLEIPLELRDYTKIIGEAMLKRHRRIRTVLAKSGAISGEYRLREFEAIAGPEKTETVHREHGCVFHVDIAKVYFSPRLSNEHSRLASQVAEDETVLDMFAGVGPFSIQIAKKREKIRVYAVDVNPDAFKYLKKNVRVNRVEAKVTPILGDVRTIVKEKLKGSVDRVIMNLPEKAIEYVDVACEALKADGGIMHYYEFSSEPNALEKVKIRLDEAVKKVGCETIGGLLARTVREIAPYTYQVVVDAKIKRVFQQSVLS